MRKITINCNIEFNVEVETDDYIVEKKVDDDGGFYGVVSYFDDAKENAFYEQIKPELENLGLKDIELLGID